MRPIRSGQAQVLRAWRFVAMRVGHRGGTLTFFGLIAVVLASSLLAPPQTVMYTFLRGIMPLPVWAALWAAGGVVCWVNVAVRLVRGPIPDRTPFAVTTLLFLGWGTLHMLAWLVYGVDRAWVAGGVWAAVGAFVAMVSTWSEDSSAVGR